MEQHPAAVFRPSWFFHKNRYSIETNRTVKYRHRIAKTTASIILYIYVTIWAGGSSKLGLQVHN